MTLSGCRVLHTGCLKVALHDVGVPLRAPEIRANRGQHLSLVPGPLAPEGVGLDILVQELVRVQVGTVAGEEEHPDPLPVDLQPALDALRPMDGVAIHDEEEAPAGVAEEAPEEPEVDPLREGLPEHHEGQLPPIGEGGEDVAAEPLPGPGDDRGVALPAVGAPGLVIGAQPHLIPPVDRGSALFRQAPDGGVLRGKPPADRRGVLLEGPAAGLLGREAPPLQVPADRPDRELEATLLPDELLHRLAGPEGEGQAQLVGTAAHDQADDQGGLVGGQPGARRPAPAFRRQRSGAPCGPLPHPLVDGPPGHPEEPGGLRRLQAASDRGDGALPQHFLGSGRERARIGSLHASPIAGEGRGVNYLLL